MLGNGANLVVRQRRTAARSILCDECRVDRLRAATRGAERPTEPIEKVVALALGDHLPGQTPERSGRRGDE